MKRPEIIVSGKSNGEGVIIHYQTAKGTEIFGLGIPNTHTIQGAIVNLSFV